MRTRASLLEELARHQPFNEHELKMLARVSAFVREHEDCFERSLLVGHVTGSAWILDEERECALLIHHAKLDKWLQPGGHCDGDADVFRVAMREAEEETGVSGIVPLLDGTIFDVDAHDIPARKNVPAHVHYDIRYAFEASRSAPFHISAESKELRWVALGMIANLNTDESVMRMVGKTGSIGARGTKP